MIRKAMWVGLLAGLVVMVGIVMFTFAPVRAQSADVETLARANQLYENGRFAEAAQTYEQVAAQGVTDAALFYNLGNAYYKLGDSGRAILNYERAALLAPRDADVYANLAMARAQVVDKYETNGGSALLRLAALGQAWLTLNETAVITLLLWLLPAGLFVLWRHSRGRLRRGVRGVMVGTAVFWLAALLLLGSRLYAGHNRTAAVILAEETAVLSGPGSQYITEFTLHAGAKVSVLETRGQWARLALPGDQLQGWVPSDQLETIPISPS